MTTEEATVLAYEELRRLAAVYLHKERSDHTLDPAGLVHEAYMRLTEKTGIDWRNEEHFVGVMACAMRQYLVDHARRHMAKKRGGGDHPLTLTAAQSLTNGRAPHLVHLDDALRELEEMDPQKVRLVELHFFGGLTFDEIAELKDVARSTIFEEWKKTRLWLFHNLKKNYGYGEAT